MVSKIEGASSGLIMSAADDPIGMRLLAGGELKSQGRRNLLKGAVGALGLAAGLGIPSFEALAQPLDANASRPRLIQRVGPSIPKWPEADEVRQVWLRRQGTSEATIARYYDGSSVVWEQYVACCTILRDVQAGTIVRMDIGLLDLVFAIQKWLVEWGIDRPLIVHSGYRSPWTNAKEGGALNSMHMHARALDFHIEGIPAEYLGRLARIFGVGGVGFYISRGFVHIDTGKVRQWAQ